MKISKHFSREEFACRCGCGFATVDIDLVRVLEKIRTHFDRPVTINSGCRCHEYNEHIGGAAGSKHQYGIAADIVVKDTDPGIVYNFVNSILKNGGVGRYGTFTHVDVRSKRARW